MPSPEPINTDRFEELLAGAVPTHEPEVRLQGLVRTLRVEAPLAPDELRERLVAREDHRPARPRRLAWGRVAVVAVPAATAAAVAAAVTLMGALPVGSDTPRRDAREPAAAETTPAAAETIPETSGRYEPTAKAPTVAELQGSANFERKATTSSLPDTARAREVDMALELRLRDADELSAAASDAMRISRELGGFVAASRVDTRGGEGTAAITLRVPVRRLEDAVLRLSALGTVTAQEVTIEDLQGGIDRRGARIERLERAIRADELRLASGTLDAEERLEVQLRLERARAVVRDVRRQRAVLLRRAATAEIDLRMHTRAAATTPEAGGASGAARDAFELLGRAGAGFVFVAIVGAPALVALAVAWSALRRRARRSEERLLAEPRPGLARD